MRGAPDSGAPLLRKNRKNLRKPLAIFLHLCYTHHVAARQVADIAQQVERILGKDEVTSSNLVISSIGRLCEIARRGDFVLPVITGCASHARAKEKRLPMATGCGKPLLGLCQCSDLRVRGARLRRCCTSCFCGVSPRRESSWSRSFAAFSNSSSFAAASI